VSIAPDKAAAAGYSISRWSGRSATCGNADECDQSARERAAANRGAVREAGRAEAHLWSVRIEGYGGPAQPSPTVRSCINGGLGRLQVMCNRCKTEASIPLDCVRRLKDTPIRKLEASLKCRSCRKRKRAPPVHMIRLIAAADHALCLGASGRGAVSGAGEPGRWWNLNPALRFPMGSNGRKSP
jgi:hypothetical protein